MSAFMSNLSVFFSAVEAAVAAPVIPDTTTEKGCGAHSSTGDANLNFFSSVVRDTPPDKVVDLFDHAFLENPHLALQNLMYLRDRDGKQEKLASQVIASHLRAKKPKTYASNLNTFVGYGCFKDLLVLDEMGKHPLIPDLELKLMAAYAKDDIAKLESLTPEELAHVVFSLVIKWLPTEGCHFDKINKAAHRIAKLLDKSMKQYRQVLTAGRTKLDILERHQSLGTWEAINFSHVPSVAMKKQKKAFMTHLPEQFRTFLSAVMAGKAKMNSKGVQAHELIRSYMHGAPADAATDAQWHAMIARLRAAGLFEDTVALCDVSGSMGGVPMEVSIALGLVVSELSAEPFKNKVITFSAVPQWHEVKGATLSEKVFSLSRAHWEQNTDFIAVFKMILAEAKVYRLRPEQMIKKIFVFTDMQFDSATNSGRYNTAFDVVKEMYTAAGYAMPQLVFWNLRDTHASFPVRKDTPGVALMSGFSAEMLKLFLDNAPMTPYSMMLRALEKYREKVVVIDE